MLTRPLTSYFLFFCLLISAQFTHANSFFWYGSQENKWSNVSSWRLKDGSIPTSIPGKMDDVFFASTESKTVFIDENIEVKNFIVQLENYQFYSLPNQSISIFGNLELSPKTKFVNPIKIVFSTENADAFIRSSSTHFNGNMIFDGKLPIRIEDDLQIEGDFILNEQEVICLNHFIATYNFNIQSKKKNESDFTESTFVIGNLSGNESKLKKHDYKIFTGFSRPESGMPKTLCSAPIPFTIVATATTNYNGFDVSCKGSADATICVSVVGGVGPFSYTWVGGPTGAGASCFPGVATGNYIVVVFDMGQGGFSCFTTVFVDEPTAMTLLSWTGTNPTCFGACDGTAVPVIVGGVPGYTYVWSTGETTPIATQLCNGLNTVQVTDANGCTFDTTFFILIPTAVAPNGGSLSTSCFGSCDGTAYSVPSGGNGAPYTFSWVPGGSVNDTIYNLCAGTYTVTVTDFMGCTGSQAITVTQPISIAVNVTSTTNLVCNGVCSGSISVNASNGTPPYAFQWYDAGTGLPLVGATSSTVSSLCAGTYYVVVTDSGGCSVQSANITITQPPPISVTVSGVDDVCNAACDGQLSAIMSGGTGALNITWYDAFTGTSIGSGTPLLNVCAGTYFGQVVDANGCIVTTALVVINEPSAINVSVVDTDLTCSGLCTGTATATAFGGTGALSVTWFNSPSGSSAGSGNPLVGMCAGDYFATITDAAGCTMNSTVFTISTPPPLVLVSQGSSNVTCNGACNGSATYVVSGGTGSITINWFQNPGGVAIGQTGNTATNLCPGSYFAVATDANGCTITSATFTITEPTALSVLATPTSSQCGTACTGSADAIISGGTAAYTISWVDAITGIPLASTGDPITNLCAGDYYLSVTDANGCNDTSQFTITSVVIVDGTMLGTDVDCNGSCNGLGNLSPFGGAPPYSFIWYDQTTGLPIGQSTEDANGLCSGSYYVIITDSDLCNSVPISVTINEPSAISINVSSTNVSCSSTCNGTITAIVTGGTPGYTLDWINSTTGVSTGQTSSPATNLCAGNYYLEATDANGCVVNSSTQTITQPASLSASVSTTNVSCFGVCDGTATLIISGGTLPYSISWSSSANTALTETNLCAGNYTYTITDANGCSIGPIPFIITQPSNISTTITNGALSCSAVCNGQVSINVSGGTSPYTYLWNDAAAQTTPVASGLCAGSFDVMVTDASGCTFGPFSATVTDPGAIAVTVSSVDAACSGGCNGSATAIITGGTSPYSIAWNDPLTQSTATAIGLCAGSYTVSITDGNGCSASGLATINNSGSPTISISSSNVSCNGVCNGNATAIVSGGTGALTVTWSTGASGISIASLCAGTYTATVTDANGCSTNAVFTITEPASLNGGMTSTTTPCSVCSATATVTASGGAGGYSYLWSASAGAQTTATATALCAGIHSVNVIDATGCSQTFMVAVSNSSSETIVVDSTNTSCNGVCDGTTTVTFVCSDPPCSILWNDPAASTTNTALALCAGVYAVTVTNNSGCIAAATINVGAPNPLLANASGTNVICNGDCTGQGTAIPTGGSSPYSYSWNDPSSQTTSNAFNLCLGNYIVTVTDSIGCTDSDTITIAQPNALSFSTSVSNVTCNAACNGTATAFPTGGVSPYSYQWADPLLQTTQVAGTLCAGNYDITVFDANNCTSGPQQVTITEPTPPSISASSVSPNCSGQCNGTATVSIVGGTSPYTVSWNDPLNQIGLTATNLCAGTFSATVTDANGCSLGSVTVTLTDPNALIAAIIPTNITCSGLCDGQLDANIAGGTAPYSVQWNDPALQTTAIASALCPGSYTINITDAKGCSSTATQTITSPNAINLNLTVTDVLCNNDCNGTATVAPTGGTGALTVLWSPGLQTTNSISSLCPGNYDVTVTDANGCSAQSPLTVNEPTLLTLVSGSSNATCGVCDGVGSVSPFGGTPPYSYSWPASASSQTTSIASALCAGVYTVTVSDSVGCVQTIAVAISNTGADTITLSQTNASCPDVCDGTVTATSTCSVAPCTFSWYNGVTGVSLGTSAASLINLCPGPYISQLLNGAGCLSFVNFSIDAPDTIDVTPTITDLICNGICIGAISVSTTGGSGAINFQWNASAGGGTTNSVSGLCAGNYDLVVADASGCDDTLTFTIAQPAAISISLTSSSVLCSGSCTGVANAIVTGGTAGYSYLWNDPLAQTTSTANSLCNGSYQVTVTDANGCSSTSPSTIVNTPAILNGTVTSIDPVCNGDCNGSGTIAVSGGTAPFSIQWTDPSSQTTSTAASLCSGTYDVTVTDANNCTDGPLTVTLTNPLAVSANVVTTDVDCNGLCNGTINLFGTGGSGSYTFSIDNGVTFQASGSFINLCAGSYSVIVMDNNLCQSSTINVNINEPTVLSTTTAFFDANCNTSNGAASVFPFGGTPAYSIVWSDALLVPIGQTTNTAINLAAGIYIATITDANGCQIQVNVTVSNINAPTATYSIVSPSCNAFCDGAINATVSGGLAPYTFQWSPGGQTTEDLTGLCAGAYIQQITDSLGCISFNNVTLAEPLPFALVPTIVDANCGQCDGSISVIASGGTGALNLTWSNLQIGNTATMLCGGSYSVLVTDANGCSNQFNYNVSNTSGPSLTLSVTNATCANVCSGSATVIPAGGTPPYSILWVEPGISGATINNVCSGTVSLEVTDSLGCVTFSSVNITAPPALSDSISVFPSNCGLCDGSAVVFGNGQAPITYQWGAAAGSVTTQAASPLCLGIYTVIVTDGNGCTDTLSALVPNVNAPSADVITTNVNCYGQCNGTANVTGSGGTAPLNFSWFDDLGNLIIAGGSSLNSLCAGNYIAEVIDALGCGSFDPFTILQPDSLVASFNFIQDETCFNTCDGIMSAMPINGTLPFTYSWTNPAGLTSSTANSLCDGIYSVTVADAKGCSLTLTDTVNQPAIILMTLDSTDASCSTVNDGSVDATVTGGAGGFTFSWTDPSGFTAITEDITNIFSGTYILTATDANGCSLTDTVIVNALLIANANAGNDTILCAIPGGLTLVGIGTAGANYTWTDTLGNILSSSTTLPLTPNGITTSYIFTVNNSGCIDSDTVNVTFNPLPNADAGSDQQILLTQSVIIGGSPTTVSGNLVVWMPAGFLDNPNLFNPNATPDSSLSFIVQVTDANGCIQYDTMSVMVFPNIVFPNGFSPNGDGANDTWILDFVDMFPDIEVSVYNRWGQPVFYSKGYDIPWDGTYQNKPVTVGTYYYVILLNHPLFPDAFTGPLTILR